MLPTYAHAIGGALIPLELDMRYAFDIWLTYHPDAARIPRVRRMIDWVIEFVRSKKISLVPRRIHPPQGSSEGVPRRTDRQLV